jgi:hypothetical protein
MNVSILSAGDIESSLAHAAVVNALNVDRVDQQADVLRVSEALAEQVRRVQVNGTWPNSAAGDGHEFSDVAQGGIVYRLRTVAAADLKLQRTGLKQLLGDVNVLVLHAKYHQPVARYLPLARAVYLQQELGLTASEALYEALTEAYGITREQLLADRPKLVGRIDKLGGAKWTVDLTKTAPAERYPLIGISTRESRPLYRDLDDVIVVACRRVAPEQKLLTEVLNEASGALIIVFAGDEDLAFAPGLVIDWLKLSQAVVAPRPGVTYVAEPLVDLRLANDAETISQLEGLNPHAGQMIWSAILAQKPARTPLTPVLRKTPRSLLIAGAIMLPLLLVLMAWFGGFVATVATVAVMLAIAAELALVCGAWQRTTRKAPMPPPLVAQPAAPAVSETATNGTIPSAIEKRLQNIVPSSNGHAHVN